MRRTVAILLFDDVEVLDFSGPFEVFAVTDELNDHRLFAVTTVAETTGPIRARNGLRVLPHHDFATAPAADLLVITGGFGTRRLLERPEILAWVRERSRAAEITASVCTGSLVLARAGVLEGCAVTTHHQRHDLLRELAPAATVHEDRRFLVNPATATRGVIATSAGISAGIDLSLHLVALLHGASVAEQTARYMEYSWRDDAGATR